MGPKPGGGAQVRIVVLLVVVTLPACTTLRPTPGTPEELRTLIREGGLVHAGDRVKVTAADQSVHEFRVDNLDVANGVMVGRGETVPIADVVALKKREPAPGKTTALALSLAYGVIVIIEVAGAEAALLSGL